MPALTFDDLMPTNVTPGGVTVGASGRPRVVIGPDSGTTGNALDFSDLIPESATDKVTRIGKDVALSAVSGLDKGVAGLAGLPADIGGWLQEKIEQGQAKVQGRPFDEVHAERAKDYVISPETLASYGGQAAHANSPLRHDPTTLPGEYAQTIGEFAPNALVPGGAAARAWQVIAPALASETAGQLTKGSVAEPYARFAGALAGGIGAGIASRPATAARAIQQQLPEGVTPQMVDQAQALMTQARRQGIDIAWPEALSQAAQRPVLTDTMRHLEAAPQTSAQMSEFFAGRPQQVDTAARGQFDRIAPVNNAPSSIGPAVGEGFEGVVRDAERARTNATSPFYRAAASDHVPTPEMQAFISNIDRAIASDKTGIVGDKLREIRSLLVESPAKPGTSAVPAQRVAKQTPNGQIYTTTPGTPAVPGQPERLITDIENLDRVRKYVRDKVGLPQIGADAITKEQGAAILRQLDDLKQRMLASSPDFAAGKALHQSITDRFLKPLMDGYIGKLASKDQTTKKAIDALFPKNPLPHSEAEIADAVGQLAKRNPRAASDLVRAHVESAFNNASKDLQTGANQAGGAKFRVQLIGNSQQRANLQGAVEALPNGKQRWDGFNKFLDILEATGTRQGIGSRTAYNEQFFKEAAKGGVAGDIVKTGANPLSMGQRFVDRYQQWKLGRNLGQLADILTDPKSANMLRAIAKAPSQSAANSVALRLVTSFNSSRNER